MFSKILIANRGEIACRVAATCRRLGVRTVAVYSDADAGARHVALCDEAIHIGAAPARESYLLADRILAAALATGAEAVHPGYGFLSENASFAQACADAGLVFIGPPASAIDAMGSKSAAKALMEAAAVPLVKGYHGDNQDAAFLRTQADLIGYPVLLKASAGGGGKGMRVVESGAAFAAAFESVKREAASSFGDDKVLIEQYLQRPRHVEIQVFADQHGNCVHVFERDCSVQRRHQKVLEEAPAPGMSDERRAAMGSAAVAAARAVGYVGAGTVEFIVNQDGSFYFMEMNTRLQVEHPVTEMISGQDLVEWQLRVAAGEPLPLKQDQLRLQGHALEARVYAENPARDFLPSTGTLRLLNMPAAVQFTHRNAGSLAAVRIDSGVREGDTISPFYDPMIAKLIVWGEDREQALARMRAALADFHVVGLSTNLAFLQRLVASSAFASADLDTGLITRNGAELFPAVALPSHEAVALAVAALLDAENQRLRRDASDRWSPWAAVGEWRMNAAARRTLEFESEAGPLTVVLENARGVLTLSLGENSWPFAAHRDAAGRWVVDLGTSVVNGQVFVDGESLMVYCAAGEWTLTRCDMLAHAGEQEGEGGNLTAPMPGKVIAVHVKAGDAVTRGAPLLVMEAMKMEHAVNAPSDGTVSEVFFTVGEQVPEGAALLAFEVVATA